MRSSHKHKCKTCGYVWQHDDSCVNDKKAHTCIKCGDMRWLHYKGDEFPGIYWNTLVRPSMFKRGRNFLFAMMVGK